MRERILQELYKRRDEFVSGTELADLLGISRVAVWKHIEALKQGYEILAISGKGYKIKDCYNIIMPLKLKDELKTKCIGKDILYYQETASTNELARKLLAEGKINTGTVIIAGRQTAGKGRRGRSWNSPHGGVWMSLLLRPCLDLQATALLSLVFAVAVASALDKFLDSSVQIKWPNDIYVNQKKLAGILLELSGELDRADYLIAGIGINVNVESTDLPDPAEKAATSIMIEARSNFNLSVVLQEVLQSLDSYYDKYIHQGFDEILEEFKDRCFHLGKEISIQAGEKVIRGINSDIDINGSLWIDTGREKFKLNTGDVALI